MTDTPLCCIVMHLDDVAAVCAIDRFDLADWAAALPVNHPDRRLVEAKCLVARAWLRGDVDGPYDDLECEVAAQILLERCVGTTIPDDAERKAA